MNSPSTPPPPPPMGKRRTGSKVILSGFIVMIAPAVIAMIGSWLGSTGAYDEGTGWGAMWWLMIVTIPLGVVIMVIGGVIGLIRTLFARR